MEKKGMSAIIATVLIILMVSIAMVLLWVVVRPFIEDKVYSDKVTAEMMKESMYVYYAGEGSSEHELEMIISRGVTDLMMMEIENVTVESYEEVPIPTEILLLLDLSGSMDFIIDEDCMKEGHNLNYPGSYCNSSSLICTSVCGGTYNNENCQNPTSTTWKDKNCIASQSTASSFCEDSCDGTSSGRTNPFEILNDSVIEFVETTLSLNNNTNISILGYGGNRFPFIDFNNDSSELLSEYVQWDAYGNTPLYEGLTYAYNNFSSRDLVDNEILIVLGDGNCRNPPGCIQNCIDYSSNFATEGVKVSSIGFGPEASTELFEGIANNEGNYYDSSDFANLAQTFRDIIHDINITGTITKEVSVPGVFLDVVVHIGGDSYTKRIIQELPGSNQNKKYFFNLYEDFGISNVVSDIDKIELYLITISRGKQENSVFMARYDEIVYNE